MNFGQLGRSEYPDRVAGSGAEWTGRREWDRPNFAAAPGRIRRLLADKGYDADWLRAQLHASGITPVIPGTRARKRLLRHDRLRYRNRWRAEAAFCRLKDFRRIDTRYDKLAGNYTAAIALAAVISF